MYWNPDTQEWEDLAALSGIVHFTCCEHWSLCGEDMSDEPFSGFGEREVVCLTCLKLDNANSPCPLPLCPYRPRSERFLWLWRRQRRQAVDQLLSWRSR